jgi:hypothetical protein
VVDRQHRRQPGSPGQGERRILIPEHAAARRPRHRGLRLLAGTRSHYYHGHHRIRGTVKEKGLQADVPVSRRVLLIDERTWFVVRATWSDAATGAYAFECINPDIRYLVTALDHQGNYRAVVADRGVELLVPLSGLGAPRWPGVRSASQSLQP